MRGLSSGSVGCRNRQTVAYPAKVWLCPATKKALPEKKILAKWDEWVQLFIRTVSGRIILDLGRLGSVKHRPNSAHPLPSCPDDSQLSLMLSGMCELVANKNPLGILCSAGRTE
ncbi:hypothetical protein Ancab_024481 [Ancistrocladus abbreviatus]